MKTFLLIALGVVLGAVGAIFLLWLALLWMVDREW